MERTAGGTIGPGSRTTPGAPGSSPPAIGRSHAAPLLRGTLAARTGVHAETIRYYEKIGLLPPPARGANGYRLYGEEHVRRLRFIRRARALGFSIEELRDLIALAEGRPEDCAAVARMAERQLARIRLRIADLERIVDTLEGQVAACRTRAGSSPPACPMLESLFGDGRTDPSTAEEALR